ncbi:hypothetical protein C8J56DRAFT_1175345 [Mycena floridula]|nr:hypothetical protein C8J56DRAFT_1175345 [Mycena floridula]
MASASEFTILSTDEDESLDSSTILPPKKPGKAAFRERLKRILKSTIASHTLLYGLHILLIFMHIVLLIINYSGIAGSVKVKLGRATTILSISLSIGSQTFAIVYLTILLYITQRLALRRVLYSTKTITGIHDRQMAWSGLGSAINSCWNQLSVSASVWGVGLITVYLALMAGLKITTPSLLTLASVPQNNTVMVDSQLNDPFLLKSMQVLPLASVYGGSHTIPRNFDLDSSFDPDGPIASAVSIVRQLPKLKTRVSGFESGLLDNMLYDVLKNNSGVGNTTVNSYTMNVSCGPSLFPYTSNITATRDGEYVFESKDGGLVVPVTIPPIAPNVLKFDFSSDWKSLLLFTSFHVVDSMEKPAPQIHVNPPMNPFDNVEFVHASNGSFTPLNPAASIHSLNMSAIYNFNVSSISFFSCSLTIFNSTIPVTAETGVPLQSPKRKTSSTWWVVDPQDYPLTDLWQLLLLSGTSGNVTISNLCGDTGAISAPDGNLELPACQYLSQAESFILDAISVSPSTNQSWALDWPISSDNAPSVKIAKVPLHELEKAIEDYTAKLFWSALYLNDLRNTAQVPVFMTEIVSELQINRLPVIAGLVLSILLLIIAPALVGWKPDKRHKASIDNLGVLEILWLDGSRQIPDVEDPSTGNLRRAGMFASVDYIEGRPAACPARR